MEDFTVETRLTKGEYVKIMYVGLYKKPAFILATIVGLYLVVKSLFSSVNSELYNLLIGLFLLLAPSLIVLMALNQLKSNRDFWSGLKYTFGENGIVIQGLTFKTELQWVQIIKQKEFGKFLILYQRSKFGLILDKTELTVGQLTFIKSKVVRT